MPSPDPKYPNIPRPDPKWGPGPVPPKVPSRPHPFPLPLPPLPDLVENPVCYYVAVGGVVVIVCIWEGSRVIPVRNAIPF